MCPAARWPPGKTLKKKEVKTELPRIYIYTIKDGVQLPQSVSLELGSVQG